MGDFPPQWTWIKDLDEGGQGHTFLVSKADPQGDEKFVLKRLKNVNREAYFDREIEACEKPLRGIVGSCPGLQIPMRDFAMRSGRTMHLAQCPG